jgi:hypothetical protein
MKKFYLMTAIAVFLLLAFSKGIQGQNIRSNLDQPKLMLQFLGNWQANVGIDTLEVWDCQVFGKAYTSNVYQVTKGHKTPFFINNISYDPKVGKFCGFQLSAYGGYWTWIGSFTSEKKLEGIIVQNFNPEQVNGKFEIIFKNLTEFTYYNYDTKGVKTVELQYVKIK